MTMTAPPRRKLGAALRPVKLPKVSLPQTAIEPPPRDARWWVGIVWLTASVVLIGFILNTAVFSGLQFLRAQQLAYGELRSALAKAEAPVGQLDLEGKIVASGTPLALIDIPDIGIEGQVISEGTTSQVLRSGPGHRRDTVLPGQQGTAVVMGRQASYGGPFSSIGQLAPGSLITVTTGQGESVFEVFSIRRAGDPMPEEPRAGEAHLELITADGLALMPSGALHIDARLVGTPKATPARSFVPAALPETEQAMATDPGAWLPAVFTAQWLVIAAAVVFWLRRRWGSWQTWLVGVPVLIVLGVTTADAVIDLLPNLI